MMRCGGKQNAIFWFGSERDDLLKERLGCAIEVHRTGMLIWRRCQLVETLAVVWHHDLM
jgi:hypothetical protein